MMYSFRKSFFPTPEEEAEMCRAAIKLHEEQIGDCSTCVNLDRSTEPGFVTDYGGCRMGKAFFCRKGVRPCRPCLRWLHRGTRAGGVGAGAFGRACIMRVRS